MSLYEEEIWTHRGLQGAQAQRKDHVDPQQGGGHAPAMEALGENKPLAP